MPAHRTSAPPLVSVLVPVYNHEAYLGQCLDSIRDEEWPRLELLLLDDGSKDASLAVTEKWVAANHARFERVFLQTQANHGLCFTLNRLIRESRGDFMILCASDDTVTSGGIRHRLEFLRGNPDCLAVFGRVGLIADESRSEVARFKRAYRANLRSWRNPRLIARQFLLNGVLFGPSTMFRRETFQEGRGVGLYDESLVLEDLDMNLRLLSRDALRFIDEPVGSYRIPEKRTFFFRPPADEFFRTYSKHKDGFSGLNRMLIGLQSWCHTPGKGGTADVKRWCGRQMLSLFKRAHRLESLFSGFMGR